MAENSGERRMKYCLIVPDGGADAPVRQLGDLTPLEAADIPEMDCVAREGLLGVTSHVPARMTPGSSVALMSVAGYDPRRYFTGRGPLEAADLGLDMGDRDWAVRCNLVTVTDGVLRDFTAGHISTSEAAELIAALDEELGGDTLSFHVGTGYRHIMLKRDSGALDAETLPPHDVVGLPIVDTRPTGPNAGEFLDLMEKSRSVLRNHPVNAARVAEGKSVANMIWLWGQGTRPRMEPFSDRFGVRGAVISAVNLARGIGKLIGWQVIHVPGATGYLDTDYGAKGRAAVESLRERDLVLVHIEAPDEASHEGDAGAKVRALEQIDHHIVGPVMEHLRVRSGRVLVMPDHITSVVDGKHKRGLVPFALWGEGVEAASGVGFNEPEAEGTGVEMPDGHDLMAQLIGHERRG